MGLTVKFNLGDYVKRDGKYSFYIDRILICENGIYYGGSEFSNKVFPGCRHGEALENELELLNSDKEFKESFERMKLEYGANNSKPS